MPTTNNYFLSGLRPMPPRDADEIHRAATPLELLFDLVSVIAIAAAAAGLHHALAEAHYAEGIIKFSLAFFAIWWAWMNYTWFASAYDNNDALFRLLTMVTMGGSLTMAAGIAPFFKSGALDLIVIGFVIMRVAMVAFWLRASKHHHTLRKTTLTYAIGIGTVQLYWVALMLNQPLPNNVLFTLFALGALLEISVPIIAERQGITPWHRHHIIERYGLLNIIVLGETLLAGTMAIQAATAEKLDITLVRIALTSVATLFCLWWLYFSKEEHIQAKRLSLAFIWGYGHLVIYMAGAATGAGFAVLIDVVAHQAPIGPLYAKLSIALPVSAYLLGLWFVRDRYIFDAAGFFILPASALLIPLANLWLPFESTALLLVGCVFLRNQQACRQTLLVDD